MMYRGTLVLGRAGAEQYPRLLGIYTRIDAYTVVEAPCLEWLHGPGLKAERTICPLVSDGD